MNILFVCSGNIFRSLTAELSIKGMVQPASPPMAVASAGIEGHPSKKVPVDIGRYLTHLQLDYSAHTSRMVTADMVSAADIVVAMGKDHQNYIAHNFGLVVPLYLQIATGHPTPLPDLWEVIADHETQPDASRKFVEDTIDCIYGNRHDFMKNISLDFRPKKSTQPNTDIKGQNHAP